jgi:hypothetical protein
LKSSSIGVGWQVEVVPLRYPCEYEFVTLHQVVTGPNEERFPAAARVQEGPGPGQQVHPDPGVGGETALFGPTLVAASRSPHATATPTRPAKELDRVGRTRNGLGVETELVTGSPVGIGRKAPHSITSSASLPIFDHRRMSALAELSGRAADRKAVK